MSFIRFELLSEFIEIYSITNSRCYGRKGLWIIIVKFFLYPISMNENNVSLASAVQHDESVLFFRFHRKKRNNKMLTNSIHFQKICLYYSINRRIWNVFNKRIITSNKSYTVTTHVYIFILFYIYGEKWSILSVKYYKNTSFTLFLVINHLQQWFSMSRAKVSNIDNRFDGLINI